MTTRLTPDHAAAFARAALGHVAREFPHKLDHVLNGPADARTPAELHPIFHGSFDWHSCVHGWWTLARIARVFPGLPESAEIERRLDLAFTPEAVAGELAYLNRASARGFERPYGWAWLLKLAEELGRREDDAGRRRAEALAPLARAFAERFRAFLPLCDYPVRSGAHLNTAFALRLALDYAEASGDAGLADLACSRLVAWHGGDVAAQAWEPDQDSFLSPTLMEAAAVRRALSEEGFRMWLGGFLPDAARGSPAALFEPAHVSDRTDGKIAHLDGLNLSRAWCWREIASGLDAADPLRVVALDAAERHLDASLAHVTGDYMGEHWLASFALLALDAAPDTPSDGPA